MQFTRLRVQNFGSIQKADISLKSRGLTLVSGVNEDALNADSNGSGKSFILDALCWGLWGDTVRGLKGDAVINNVTEKNCCVSVEFVDGGVGYRVSRYRKHSKSRKPNDLELWIDGVEDSGATMSITQERVNTLVGLEFSTFRAMMPGAGMSLSQMADADIKELFEKLLQTDILTKAYAHVRSVYKDKQRHLDANTSELSVMRDAISDRSSRLAAYREKHAAFEEEKAKQCNLVLFQVSKLDSKVKEQLAERDRIQGLLTSPKELNAVLKRLSTQVLTSQTNLEKIQTHRNLRYTELHSQLAVAESVLTAARAAVFAYAEFAEQSECSVCKQVVPEAHKAEVEKTLVNAFSEAEKTHYDLKESFTEQIQKLDSDVSAHRESLSTLTADFLTAKEEQGNMQAQQCALSAVESLLETLDAQRAEAQESLLSWQSSVSPFQDLIEDVTTELTQKQEALREQEAAVAELSQGVADLEFWVHGFSPKGVRSFMLEHIVPYLNSRALHYCGLLTGHDLSVRFDTKTTLKSTGKVKEAFRVIVSMKNGTDTYEGASEGERARINLVLALVLGDLASLRSNKKLTFRFLDEPFEKMDESGTESVVSVLNAHKDEYDTTFVVTHKNHFKSLFNNVITVTKQNGVSHISES